MMSPGAGRGPALYGGGLMGAGIGPLNKADRAMYELQQKDMELERQSRALAMEYAHGPKENREKLKEEIIALVNKQFDVRQHRRTLELKRLEEELKHLRDMLERRTKARKELVEKRVSDLVGPAEPGVDF
jgi:phage-related minor tail protein